MAESSPVLLFDTQRAVEELVAAGVPQGQAAVLVRLQAHWAQRNFATGEDIERLSAALTRDMGAKIEAQGAALAKDMGHLREDLEGKIEAQGTAGHKDLESLRGALGTKIAESAGTTIKWVTGMQVGTAAVYLAALLWALKL